MTNRLAFSAVIAIAIPLNAVAAEKPRVYVTESGSVQVSGDASVGDGKGAFSIVSGASPQNVEVIKAFIQRCPEVVVTANRDKADYVVRLDHEAPGPTTPFVRGNKVAVFNKSDDVIYAGSTRMLSNAVKGACAAIVAASRK